MQRDVRYTRRRLLVVGAASAVPALAWWRSSMPSSSEPDVPTLAPTTAAGSHPAPTTGPDGSSTSATSDDASAPAPDTTTPVFEHELAHGMAEPKVVIVQDRLRAVAFDPGPSDGIFGDATLRAVWAFEKLVMGVPRENVTGVVDAQVWQTLHEPAVIAPRRSIGGTHVEVYLPEQVAVVFRDGVPAVVTHVSTGPGVEWCDEVTVDNDDGTTSLKGICGRSVTPGGVFHVERKVDGWRNAPLGRLYKPVYFNYGIALHGASRVPDEPASRGCVRLPMHVAEYVPDLLNVGDTVLVFDGVDEPEHYGAQLPVFDWPDPEYVPPTTLPGTDGTATTSPTS